jgi:hypothetical protein
MRAKEGRRTIFAALWSLLDMGQAFSGGISLARAPDWLDDSHIYEAEFRLYFGDGWSQFKDMLGKLPEGLAGVEAFVAAVDE